MKTTFNTKSLPPIHLIPGSVWSQLKNVKQGKSGKKSAEIWSESEAIQEIRKYGGVFVNDVFMPIWDTAAQILLLEGSYGSSKTTYAITRLLVKCMESKVFKCFYGRQEKEMAKQMHSNIIREIKRNNWEHLFDYSEQPNGTKKIFCLINGNCFELFGCDNEETLKGIDNPTHIFVDEINQISFESFGMLITRLRSSGGELQFIGCFNPCDVLPDHWIVKYIYQGGKNAKNHTNSEEKSYTEEELAVIEALNDLDTVTHHSVYLDNYFQNPDSYWHKLVLKAKGDMSRAKDFAEGRWGIMLNAKPYYKNFKHSDHVFKFGIENAVGYKDGYAVDETGRQVLYYDPNLPLLVSFDDNTQPFLPALIAQRHGDQIWFIDEITLEHPDNNIYSACNYLKQKYERHKSRIEIYGDATAVKDDTKLLEGENFFTMIIGLLKDFKTSNRVPEVNPRNKTRGLFINTIFSLNYGGIEILISKNCKKFIEDLENCMEALDENGSINGKKDKTTKMINGKRNVQPFGHLGDCMDYLICESFSDIYEAFKTDGSSNAPTGGKYVNKKSLDFLDKRINEITNDKKNTENTENKNNQTEEKSQNSSVSYNRINRKFRSNKIN